MREHAEYWRARYDREHPGIYAGRIFNIVNLALVSGQLDYVEALARFRQALEAGGLALDQAPRSMLQTYGGLQSLAGDHQAAIRTLAPLVDLEIPAADTLQEAFLTHTLAWAYLQAGESDRARRSLERLEAGFADLEARGQLHLANEIAIYALHILLRGDMDRALDLLEQAEQGGWRRIGAVLQDPRWAAVREQPRFRAIVARVESDIAVQRARVEARDAEDDFEARLDAAIAAQQAQPARH
jgi:hypothetical protein